MREPCTALVVDQKDFKVSGILAVIDGSVMAWHGEEIAIAIAVNIAGSNDVSRVFD